MSKARYITALVLGAIIFVVGIILICVFVNNPSERGLFIGLSYVIATIIIHLIWHDSFIVRIALFGFGICGAILGILHSMFSGFESKTVCGVIWGLIVLMCAAFLLSAIVTVITFTLFALTIASSILFPFSVIRNAVG